MLTKGTRFVLNGHRFKVVYVNESRAHCESIDKQRVTIAGRTFWAKPRLTLDISPSTDLRLVEEMQRCGSGC